MNQKQKIYSLLKNRILFLDGATGTELQKKGMPPGACPEIWSLDNPACMSEIHRAYADAGSDIIYTCTFGGNRLKLEQYGTEDVRGINRRLASLARNAVGKNVLVAGDVGPTGHFVEPFGTLSFEEAVNLFKEQITGLIEGGVDLLVIETIMDIQEARAALIAAKECCDLFVMVSMTFEPTGRTLNGTDPLAALITLQSLGANAVGCNCSTGPDAMVTFINAMKPYATVPLLAKPNAGLPQLINGETSFHMPPHLFAEQAAPIAHGGANLMGGCCGTTPEHIRALKEKLGGKPPLRPARKAVSAVSSARKARIFTDTDHLIIAGERINPTGKKDLQKSLLEGKLSLVRQMAHEQEKSGADILDINIGVPHLDEQKTIREIIRLLSITTELPLTIDSSCTDTIKTALRYYPGRLMINSISGEPDKMEELLPIAAQYGAMFILLPLAGKELPDTVEKRIPIIKSVYQRAKAFGIRKEDIIVDGLVMTVASSPEASAETLQTIAWCTKNRFQTIIGLSNVSFGLPERQWINGAFLVMARQTGLKMAIANPSIPEIMALKHSADVLLNHDHQAASYISYFAEKTKGNEGTEGKQALLSTNAAYPNSSISKGRQISSRTWDCILEGNSEDILDAIREDLPQCPDPAHEYLVNHSMIPAINHVGTLFEEKRYFLPQLLASAEAMKKGMAYLEPLLHQGKSTGGKGLILITTVEGDIHDIGKNIVALLLGNQGYRIVDLGKDAAAQMIVRAIKEHKPDVVALSALMTTTMIRMKEVIDLARKEGEECPFMVGGAVVTASFADSIGAYYAKDGVEAGKVMEIILRSAV